MMSVAKILLIMLTINGFLYLSGATLFDSDIFDSFATVSDSGDTVVDYATFGDNLPQDTGSSVGSLTSDSSSFSFFDALGLVMDLIKFLLNIILAPVAVFVSTGMPLMLQILIGVPLGVLYGFGIVVLIRGGGA